MADGVLTLLNFSAKELRTIETLTLTPRDGAGLSDETDQEIYQISGLQILHGDGSERVIVLHTASRDEVVLLQIANSTREVVILTDTNWRAFLEDLELDPRAASLKRASLICR